MTTPRTPGEPPPYRLEHEPDGRSWTARENLADILERELLGPANGPEEVLDGSPDSAYLIGRIAPVKLTAGTEDPTDADTGEPDSDVGDAEDAESGRGVPLTGVDDSGAGADEDSGTEDEPQQRGLMIPASMGLRCQIPDDLESFTVTATWGVYESVPEKDPERQRVVRRYKRTPVEIPTLITVAGLRQSATTEIPAQGQGRAAGGPVRRPRARLPADRDRAVQRPGDAAENPGRRLAVPDQAHRRGGRGGRVPAGQRPARWTPGGAGRRAAAAAAAVQGPAGVRGRADLLGRLGRGPRAPGGRARCGRRGCRRARRRRSPPRRSTPCSTCGSWRRQRPSQLRSRA